MSFGSLVYALCALTSCGCAVLLARGYRRTRARLLLWSSCCFVGLFFNNVLLFIDRAVVPGTDLMLVRQIPAVAGVMLLIYGLVWDATH